MARPSAPALLLLALLAVAATATARPLAGTGRRLHEDLTLTTFNVQWDTKFVPYPLVEAKCGDLVTFRWEGAEPQTVAVVQAATSADALATCRDAVPLTSPTTVGEHTEELLSAGTLFFVEPSRCQSGQVLVVKVACDSDHPEPVARASFLEVVSAPAPEGAASFATTSDEAAPSPALAPEAA